VVQAYNNGATKVSEYKLKQTIFSQSVTQTYNHGTTKVKDKAVPLQAWTGPVGSRKLRFPHFMAMAQDGGRLSALRNGCLYPRKYSWYSFLLEAELTPGP